MEETVKQLQAEIKALQDQVKGFEGAKTQLEESSQFIQDASVLVGAIMKDPALKTQVQASIAGQPVTPVTPTTPITPPVDDKKDWKFDPVTGKPVGETPAAPAKDQRVDSLDGRERLKIIDAVEAKFKYSNLKPEEKSQIRKNVGSWLSSYGMKVAEIPVDQLEEKLNDAYLHVGLETATKEGKATDVLDSYFEDPGKLPGMGGGTPDDVPSQLNATQKKWAGKLQVSEDKVAAGLKELTETGVITYKPKEPNSTVKTPAPSGTPTPPPASN